MNIKLIAVIILTFLVSVAVAAPPGSVQGLRHQVDELAGLVENLQTELAETRKDLQLVKTELAELRNNTVLGLDGFLRLEKNTNEVYTALFSDVNVQVVNGDGLTDIANGRGNLVLGYNAQGTAPLARQGSHNLILGDNQGYSGVAQVVTAHVISNQDLSLVAGGNMATDVGNDQTVTVGKNRKVQVGGDYLLDNGASLLLSTGMDANIEIANDAAVTIGGNTALVTSGDAQLLVEGEASVEAREELLLEVGNSSVILKKAGDINIEGKDIEIEASARLHFKAPVIEQN